MTHGQRDAVDALYAAWGLWLAIWIVLSRRVKRVRRQESTASHLVHLLPLAIGAVLLLFTTRDGRSWLEIPLLPRAAWMAYGGAALTCTGLGVAIWARLVLAGNWSGTVTLKQGHELVVTGPYAWVRHPIYTGLLTAMLGTAIAIDQVRGILALTLITASFLRKLRTEEAFMQQEFDARYARYQARVARLIPGLW